jgi:hypothetical protein
MNEPASENPKAPKRSKRKPAMEPLGWDEIVSQPGMGGYLSFLYGPVPLPHLQSSTGLAIVPVVVSPPESNENPDIISTPVVNSYPEAKSNAEHLSSSDIANGPAHDIIPGSGSTPGAVSSAPSKIAKENRYASPTTPEVVSIPAVQGRLRIRRCLATHDGHSLGEEVLYQAIWKAAHPEGADSRTIAIGWRGMSQLCRMTPKNCKINTQRLIRKLALEVLSPYNTPESIGTTYRVYSDLAIFQRRRAASLEWVVRSRGVEFVDPATGTSILPICAHTYTDSPR